MMVVCRNLNKVKYTGSTPLRDFFVINIILVQFYVNLEANAIAEQMKYQ